MKIDIQTTRESFQDLMERTIGSENVYAQKPNGITRNGKVAIMSYPAVLYSMPRIEKTFANNKAYIKRIPYAVTYIHKDIDDPNVEKLSNLPYSNYERRYVADGLYHDVFNIYY